MLTNACLSGNPPLLLKSGEVNGPISCGQQEMIIARVGRALTGPIDARLWLHKAAMRKPKKRNFLASDMNRLIATQH
jgi:hypothetical protein